jgi:hypothetical protein
MVGIGEEDAYVFFVPATSMHAVMSHLVLALDNSSFSIRNSERDRMATYRLDDQTYPIPLYAKTARFYSSTVDGFTVEHNKDIPLTANTHVDTVQTGVWCRASNIDMPSERYATRDGRDFELCQIELKLFIAQSFARVDLNIWGGQYSGDIDKDPNFKIVFNGLLSLCTYCIYDGNFNTVAIAPDLGVIDDDDVLYCEMDSPDDIVAVIKAWSQVTDSE